MNLATKLLNPTGDYWPQKAECRRENGRHEGRGGPEAAPLSA